MTNHLPAAREDCPSSPASSVPTLSLVTLSDALSATWPALASEFGLTLVSAREPRALDRLSGMVAVISAVGVEELIEPAVRKMAPAGAHVAGVGALADYRLGMSVMRAGAADYFALPGDYDLLRSWLREWAERLKSHQRRSTFAAGEEAKYRFEGIVGNSAALHAALDCATRIIPHPEATVLLVGETGTGKELLARAIHYAGPRCQAPFVEINCAATPEHLLESQLFGHERGALTDARMARPGLFEITRDGTLFLEQIEHLSLSLQGKLLRALEERRIRRLGGTHWIPIDARVIAASNVPLAAAVRGGQFREDLYSRLNVFPIKLPPLRARREDILPLVRHFLARFVREYGLPEPALSARAERSLRFHRWPGNVGELCNVIERAVLTSRGGQSTASISHSAVTRTCPRTASFPSRQH